MMFSGTIDAKVQAMVCQPVGSSDVPYGPGSISWVTARGRPEGFCRRLQAIIESEPAQVVVPFPVLWEIGGFVAHLETTKYSSGLVSATVHNESHNIVAYSRSIFECGGMHGGTPQIRYPGNLADLSIGGFSLSIQPHEAEINDGQKIFSYITRGETSVHLPGSPGEGQAKATLVYHIARGILPDISGEYEPFLLMAEVSVDKGNRSFSLELDVGQSTCAITYSAGEVSHVFSFDDDGSLYDVLAIVSPESRQPQQRNVERSSWNSAFGACFNLADSGKLPVIDFEKTLLKMIHPFTGHQLLPPDDLPQPVSPSLSTFVSYRQPELALQLLLPLEGNDS